MDNEQLLDVSCDRSDKVLLETVTGTGSNGGKQMILVAVPGVLSVAFNNAKGLTSEKTEWFFTIVIRMSGLYP